MSIILKTPSNGSVTLAEQDTASDVVVTVPAVTATLLNNSSGVMNIGSGQVYKDASGNVGIGVTPSAWVAGFNTLSASRDAVFGGATGGAVYLFAATNAYATDNGDPAFATWRYKLTGSLASRYDQFAGVHRWYTAPSGTAGNAISFTQAMTLQADGTLLVGATSVTGAATGRTYLAKGGIGWHSGPNSSGAYVVINQNDLGVFVASGGTSWTANSDERIKDIIEPITDAANKVSTLRAVIGKYKSDEEGTRRAFLIAQDVQAVLPEAVNVQNDEQGTLGLQYTDVIPLLVSAIQEQQAIIIEQQAALTQLQADVAALQGAA